MRKLKNNEKRKRTPVNPLSIILGVAILLLFVGIYIAFVLIFVPDVSAPDFAYTTRCGVDFYDIDNDAVMYQFPDGCTVIHQYDFSPDGQRIVYTGDNPRVVIAQIQPYQVETVLDDVVGDVSALAWSPDGEKIAFWKYLGAQSGQALLIYEVATGDIEEHGIYSLRHPSLSWSPNSAELLFTIDQGSNTEIVHYSLTTQEITQVTDDSLTNRNPVWSNTIAFYTGLNTTTYRDELRTLNLQTGESLMLLQARTVNASPSPSGNAVVLQLTDDNGYPAVYWMNLKTMTQYQVTPYEAQAYLPRWLPTSDFTP